MITLGITASGYAQNQTRADHRFDKLKSFLALTEDQSVKVKEILAKAEEQTAKEQNANPVNKRKQKRNAKIRMKEMDKQIEALLTPEQLKKYQAYKIERNNGLKGRREGTRFYRD